MIVILFVSLFFLLLISAPLYIALAGSSFAAIYFTGGLPPVAAVGRVFAGLDKFALMAIPFFILAAEVMKNGGMSRRIVNMANSLVGGLNGGLAFTTILACMFFGALCGSSPATVAAIGSIVFPPLIKADYGKDFSSGLVTSSSAVALLIPPSITMIVYAVVAGVSVGALFMAGFGAGIVYGLLFAVYSVFYARKRKVILQKKSSFKGILVAFKGAVWDLGVAVIVIGGIYGGVFTPTEAAAISAVYAIFVTMAIHRELSFKGLYKSGFEAAKTISMVMIMIGGASALSWVLIVGGVPQSLGSLILGVTESPWIILLLMVVVMLIAGMFMDGTCFVLVLTPLFVPIARDLGVDLVHLGIITVAAASIGMYTPPFGLNLFVATGITKSTFEEVVRGVWPFIGVSLIVMLIITYVPEISMWLPNQLYG